MIIPAPPAMPTLEFRSGADAVAFLGRLPMADPVQTHESLTRFFHALARRPLPPMEQAPVLAQAEKPLAFVQEEAARRYLGRPLPYGEQELPLFRRTVQLWQDAADAWLAAEPPTGGDADTAAILERALFCRGMAVVEHLLARFQIPPGLWRSFHEIFEESERRQVADFVFQDPAGRNLSCTRAYGAVLLFDMAKPYSLRSRDLPLVWRWARSLGQLLKVLPVEAGGAVPFVVDLAGDKPLIKALPGAIHPTSVRRLETEALANHLRKLRRRLAEGLSPGELQLGSDVAAADAARLLAHLKYPWTQEAIARPFDLGQPIGPLAVVLGYEAIHYRITGREVNRPQAAREAYQFSRQDADRLAVFGTARDGAASLRDAAASRYAGESWSLLEHNAGALRLHRAGSGGRVAVGQLTAVAADPAKPESLALARISSLMQTGDGGVMMKVKRLSGVAIGVAIQALGANLPAQPLVGGFLIQALGEDGTAAPELVMPRGWYQKQRLISLDFHDPEVPVRRYRLEKVIFGGHDYDLVACVADDGSYPN